MTKSSIYVKTRMTTHIKAKRMKADDLTKRKLTNKKWLQIFQNIMSEQNFNLIRHYKAEKLITNMNLLMFLDLNIDMPCLLYFN